MHDISSHLCSLYHLLEKPELEQQLVRKQMAIVALTVRLSCAFTGSPTPEVTWFKNGERIVFNGRIKVITVIMSLCPCYYSYAIKIFKYKFRTLGFAATRLFKKGKRQFNSLFQMQDEEVVISQSESRDSGYYQCRAENDAGMAQGTIHLSVVPSSKAFKSYIINNCI